jgi:SnoaL-like domain
MHFNGQSTTRVDGARASAVTYCQVHELTVDQKTPRSLNTVGSLKIAAIRYLDSFVKRDGKWFIRQRQVVVDWTETRPLATS